MAAVFRSGKTGEASVSGTPLSLESWTTNYQGNVIETTNFESNGCYQGVTGIRKLAWTLKGQWDFTPPYYTKDPPGLYPRDDGSDMTLTMSTQDEAGTWSMPSFICEHANVSTTATGNISFDAAGSSQGQFTQPSGVTVSSTMG